MERVLDELSFDAPERKGEQVTDRCGLRAQDVDGYCEGSGFIEIYSVGGLPLPCALAAKKLNGRASLTV
jgi:hypothetical protein